MRSCLFLLTVGIFLALLGESLAIDEQVKRVVSRMLLPVLDWSYPRTGRNEVTVMQIDDDDLQEYDEKWPIEYDFHRRRLLQIARLDQPEAMRPRAIFIDILFLDARREDPKPLAQALCRIAEGGVAVYLASLHWTGHEYPRTRDFSGGTLRDGRPCVTEVAVQRKNDTFDAMTWDYKVVSGKDKLEMESAALAMYRTLEREKARLVPKSDLSLIWGTTSHPSNAAWMWREVDGQPTPTCAPYALPVFGPRGAKTLCPYNRVLPVRALKRNAVDSKVLDDALARRAVIYGTNLQSASDLFRAPAHDEMSGLHLHAMALDNMISFEGRTKLSEGFDVLAPNRGTWFTLIALLVLTALMTGMRRNRRAYDAAARRWVDLFFPRRSPSRSRRRGAPRVRYLLCTLSFRVLAFIAKALVYITVALAIGALGYLVFNLGPLSWIEYALFFILASFIHGGERLEKWSCETARRSARLRGYTGADQFKREATVRLIPGKDAGDIERPAR